VYDPTGALSLARPWVCVDDPRCEEANVKSDQIIDRLVERYPDLHCCRVQIADAFEMLQVCFRQRGKALVCGNGGSAADSEHIVGELMKGYMQPRQIPTTMRERLLVACPGNGRYLADHLQGALPAISLVSQTAFLSAYANDVAADMVFAQQVYGYGHPGDVLWGISTSGNAKNVIHALQVGHTLNLSTLGLTGQDGGAMLEYCDVAIRVPSVSTPDVQERHVAIYHALCLMLEREFFSPA
jgi:D-sedoheptulose 7-phosphate isomerase